MLLVLATAVGFEGSKTVRRGLSYRRQAEAWGAIRAMTAKEIEETRRDAEAYRRASRMPRNDAEAMGRWAETLESRLPGLYAEEATYAAPAARYRSAAKAPWRLAPPDPPVPPSARSRLQWMTR